MDQEFIDLVLGRLVYLIFELSQRPCDGQFLADQWLGWVDRVAS
jgi:hypothetical protein